MIFPGTGKAVPSSDAKDVDPAAYTYLQVSHQWEKASTPQGVVGGRELREGAVTLIPTLSVWAISYVS